MEKQKKQLLILGIVLLVLVGVYAGIRVYNDKQSEKEAAAAEAETVSVTDLAVEDVTAFSYMLDGEKLSFTKNGDAWQYDGDTNLNLDESALETMLSKVTSITATDSLSEYGDLSEYGLDEPSNVITITTAEGTVTLSVGTKNAITSGYYMMRDDSTTLYLVNATAATGCSRTLDELTAEDTEETEAVEEENSTEES